jgi:hypothetical protein
MEERIRSLERTVKLQACELKRMQGIWLENQSPSPNANSSANQNKRTSSGTTTSSSQVTTPTDKNPITQRSTAVNRISSDNDNEIIREGVINVNKPQPKNVSNTVSGPSHTHPTSSSSSSSRYPSSTSSFATTSAAIQMILKSPTTIKPRRNRNILVEKTSRTITIWEKKKKAQKSISNYLRTVGPLEISEKINMKSIIESTKLFRKNNMSTVNRNYPNKITKNSNTSNINTIKKGNTTTNGISNNDNINSNNISTSSTLSSSSNLKRKNTSSDLTTSSTLAPKRTKKMPISHTAAVTAVNSLNTTSSQSQRILANAGIVNEKNLIDDDVVILNGRSAPPAHSLSSPIPASSSSRPRSATTAGLAAAGNTGTIRPPDLPSSHHRSPSSSSSIPRPAFIAALDTAKAARTGRAIQEALTPQRNTILDITGDPVIPEKGRVEGDQEMEKMNKVITLIKSLDSPVDRIQMVQQLLDTFQTKPVKTKKLIDAGKEVFQEWLAEEISKFPEKVDILLIESILSIMDKATWTVDDVCRLRIDKTLRVLYKACCSTDKLTSTEYSNIMNQAKKMWPRYRNMFKNVAKI